MSEGYIDVPGGRVWARFVEMHRRIPGSQLAIIEDASRLCFAEQPAEFTDLVNDFFDRTGPGSPPRPAARS